MSQDLNPHKTQAFETYTLWQSMTDEVRSRWLIWSIVLFFMLILPGVAVVAMLNAPVKFEGLMHAGFHRSDIQVVGNIGLYISSILLSFLSSMMVRKRLKKGQQLRTKHIWTKLQESANVMAPSEEKVPFLTRARVHVSISIHHLKGSLFVLCSTGATVLGGAAVLELTLGYSGGYESTILLSLLVFTFMLIFIVGVFYLLVLLFVSMRPSHESIHRIRTELHIRELRLANMDVTGGISLDQAGLKGAISESSHT